MNPRLHGTAKRLTRDTLKRNSALASCTAMAGACRRCGSLRPCGSAARPTKATLKQRPSLATCAECEAGTGDAVDLRPPRPAKWLRLLGPESVGRVCDPVEKAGLPEARTPRPLVRRSPAVARFRR